MVADSQTSTSARVGADSLIALLFVAASTSIATRHHLSVPRPGEFFVVRLTIGSVISSIGFGIIWHKCFSLSNLYIVKHRSLTSLTFQVARACGIMTILLAIYLAVFERTASLEATLLWFFSLAFCYELLRCELSNYRLHLFGRAPETILILGTGRTAQKAWRELRINHHRQVEFLGFVGKDFDQAIAPDLKARQVCTVKSLQAFFLTNVVDTLIIATSLQRDFAVTQKAITIAEGSGTRIVTMQDTFELGRRKCEAQSGQTFLHLAPWGDLRSFYLLIKLSVDRILAGLALLLLMPITIPIYIFYSLVTDMPALVGQKTYGYRRRSYTMWDFGVLSMTASPSEVSRAGVEGTEHSEFTADIDKLIHLSGMNKLPRLWNVVRGEMSLVGPRPLQDSWLTFGGDSILSRRFMVRPGICGAWTVLKTDKDRTVSEMMEADDAYLDQWSLMLDWKLFYGWFYSRWQQGFSRIINTVPEVMVGD